MRKVHRSGMVFSRVEQKSFHKSAFLAAQVYKKEQWRNTKTHCASHRNRTYKTIGKLSKDVNNSRYESFKERKKNLTDDFYQ